MALKGGKINDDDDDIATMNWRGKVGQLHNLYSFNFFLNALRVLNLEMGFDVG